MANSVLMFAIVLSIFGAIVVRAEVENKEALTELMTRAEECKKEVNAKDSDLEEMATRKPASTKEGKCLRACLMKKFDVMDANGKFVPEVAEKHAAQMTNGSADRLKLAREIINACANIVVSTDHCQAAEDYGKCFKEQADIHGTNSGYEF